MLIDAKVDGVSVSVLLDSGAGVSVLSSRVKNACVHLKRTSRRLRGAGGSSLRVLGEKIVQLEIGNKYEVVKLYVVDGLIQDCILGVDALRKMRINLLFDNGGTILCGGDVLAIDDTLELDVGSNLTNQQRNELEDLLVEFKELFQPILPGSAVGVEHGITLKSECSGPIVKKSYRIPLSSQKVISDHVSKMLEKGIIEPSSSPYSAPVVLAKKKDGSERFCVDYRALNEATKRDQHPLPRVDDLLDRVKGAKFFSSLDLTSGYWQVKMKDCDAEKTAFSTPDGHFQFKVMPFGLTNAPATFQRLMNSVVRDIKSVLAYIDDLLVFSVTWEDHLHTLRKIFLALRKFRLKLQGKKCHFGCPKILFLGHVVDQEGCRPDPDKTNVIRSISPPRNVKELRQFLGLANYYRRFVQNFSSLASSLFELLKKDVSWKWGRREQECFDFLKKNLCEAPVLASPDPSLPYRLYTDASGVGMGAVLCQFQNGAERVIAYASRLLQKREIKFSVIEKEALAVVWGMKHFYPYLHGCRFKVMSDHAPLKWLFQKNNIGGRLGRWQAFLLNYEGLEGIEYLRGEENAGADALSRLHSDDFAVDQIVENSFEQEISLCHQENEALPDSMSPNEWRCAQESDSDFSSDDLKLYQGVWIDSKSRLFVPSKCKGFVLRAMHGQGVHFGVKRTLDLIRQAYFWKHMDVDVSEWIRSCDICSRAKHSAADRLVPHSLPTSNRPFERVFIDYAGPLSRTQAGNRYFLVIVDDFSRFLKVFPVRDCSAETTRKCFIRLCFDEGVPSQVVSDNGTHFTADKMTSLFKELGIQHIRTAPYHPASNGMAERAVRTIKSLIRARLLESYASNSWDVRLPEIVFQYNAAIHPGTGASPFVVVRGRTPPISHPFCKIRLPSRQVSVSWQDISQNSNRFKSSNCENKGGKLLPDLDVGNKVWVRRRNREEWEQGKIVERIGNVMYKVEVTEAGTTNHFHRNQIVKRN